MDVRTGIGQCSFVSSATVAARSAAVEQRSRKTSAWRFLSDRMLACPTDPRRRPPRARVVRQGRRPTPGDPRPRDRGVRARGDPTGRACARSPRRSASRTPRSRTTSARSRSCSSRSTASPSASVERRRPDGARHDAGRAHDEVRAGQSRGRRTRPALLDARRVGARGGASRRARVRDRRGSRTCGTTSRTRVQAQSDAPAASAPTSTRRPSPRSSSPPRTACRRSGSSIPSWIRMPRSSCSTICWRDPQRGEGLDHGAKARLHRAGDAEEGCP